jgi:hypothetical protein
VGVKIIYKYTVKFKLSFNFEENKEFVKPTNYMIVTFLHLLITTLNKSSFGYLTNNVPLPEGRHGSIDPPSASAKIINS